MTLIELLLVIVVVILTMTYPWLAVVGIVIPALFYVYLCWCTYKKRRVKPGSLQAFVQKEKARLNK